MPFYQDVLLQLVHMCEHILKGKLFWSIQHFHNFAANIHISGSGQHGF